jgi:hypothetical protein
MIKLIDREFVGDVVRRVQAGSPGSDGASPYPELCPTAPGELIPGRKDHPKP